MYVLAELPRIQAVDFSCSGTTDEEQGTLTLYFLYVCDESSNSSPLLRTFDDYLPGHVVESSAECLFLEFISDYMTTEQGFLIHLEGWHSLYATKFGPLSKNMAKQLLVQSLNYPFFQPHIRAEPRRAKEESRITCMRILRKLPSPSPPPPPLQSGEKHIWKSYSSAIST